MINLLLVDDDLQSLDSTRKILELAGYQVTTAMNGREAYQKLQTAGFDLVISDVRMPEMTGLELLHAMALKEITTPVLLMTAYGTVEDAVWAMKKGAIDFLMKPFRRTDLLLRVSDIAKHVEAQNSKGASSYAVDATSNARSQKWQELDVLVRQVAMTDVNVLIEGESGSGKERVARRIHQLSDRKGAPWIAINCAAIPENLIEAELFGFEKGSFTGAHQAKAGLFEQAHGGTLLLDEVGDLPLQLQATLLRVLQEGEVRRIGATSSRRVNVRILSATHRNLAERVKEGLFREDLRFRLDVVSLQVPALRERSDDILPLAESFLKQFKEEHRRPIHGLSVEVKRVLEHYLWPGNIRELSNAIERAVVLCRGDWIETQDLPPHLASWSQTGESEKLQSILIPVGTPLKDIEDLLIQKTLELTDGDKNLTAKLLGITSRTIYRKLGKFEDRGSSE